MTLEEALGKAADIINTNKVAYNGFKCGRKHPDPMSETYCRSRLIALLDRFINTSIAHNIGWYYGRLTKQEVTNANSLLES